MGASVLISLALSLLQSVLSAAKVSGIPADIVTLLEGSVTNLIAVQGTPVTYSQLEGLRVKTEW